jgi:hypothetical protein
MKVGFHKSIVNHGSKNAHFDYALHLCELYIVFQNKKKL